MFPMRRSRLLNTSFHNLEYYFVVINSSSTPSHASTGENRTLNRSKLGLESHEVMITTLNLYSRHYCGAPRIRI